MPGSEIYDEPSLEGVDTIIPTPSSGRISSGFIEPSQNGASAVESHAGATAVNAARDPCDTAGERDIAAEFAQLQALTGEYFCPPTTSGGVFPFGDSMTPSAGNPEHHGDAGPVPVVFNEIATPEVHHLVNDTLPYLEESARYPAYETENGQNFYYPTPYASTATVEEPRVNYSHSPELVSGETHFAGSYFTQLPILGEPITPPTATAFTFHSL